MSQEQEIVWLASYPKSGNTWLRFLIACLMEGELKSSGDVARTIPEYGSAFELEARAKKGRCVIKTHFTFDKIKWPQKTVGFIYIMRHPLDVMVSNYKYHLLKLSDDLGCDPAHYENSYYNVYYHKLGEEFWFDYSYGTWYENVISWVRDGAAKHPHFIIRYEDMHKNPYVVAQGLNSFLKLERTDEEIRKAIEYSSFKNMKKLEEKEIESNEDTFFKRETFGAGKDKGLRFMNQGKSGGHKERLTAKQLKEGRKVFQAPMQQFGYK